jgi:hypothetical protein
MSRKPRIYITDFLTGEEGMMDIRIKAAKALPQGAAGGTTSERGELDVLS